MRCSSDVLLIFGNVSYQKTRKEVKESVKGTQEWLKCLSVHAIPSVSTYSKRAIFVCRASDRIYSWLLCELWYSHTIVKHGQMPVVSLFVFSPTALLSIRHTGQRQIFLSECTHKYTSVHSEIYCPLVKKCKKVSLFHTWSNPLRFQMTFTHHNSMTHSWRLELKQGISMHKENMNRKKIWTNGKIWTEKS